MPEELVGVLLAHRRELGMALADERLEHARPNALLERRTGRRRLVALDGLARLGVAAGEQAVGELVHLAVEARRRVGLGAEQRVGGEGQQVSGGERREGEERLDDRVDVAAVAEVAQTGQTRAGQRLEVFAVLARHRKVEDEVLLDLLATSARSQRLKRTSSVMLFSVLR